MGEGKRWKVRGCVIVAAIIVGVPLLIVAVVGVQTWRPLQTASDTLLELERSLGAAADFVPAPTGEIAAERLAIFLDVRRVLVAACGDYGIIQQGFDSVESLETKDAGDLSDVGDVASGLGAAALAITPFLARYFEQRNAALLAAQMGLEEYSYIYAVAYHERLLSASIQREIFSDGEALSPEAATMLRECLARQLAVAGRDPVRRADLEVELQMMADDSTRLMWQDGLPEAMQASIDPVRGELDQTFCAATAGLEMERDAGRALRVAIE